MNILKRMRRMAKFTAEQVADYLGINQSDYSVIEQGTINDCPRTSGVDIYNLLSNS